MMLKMFAIRDSKAEAFKQPYFCHTHGEAERSFTQLVRDPQSVVSQYPDDFDLYFLGEYNDQTGVIKSLETPQHITKAVFVLGDKKVN